MQKTKYIEMTPNTTWKWLLLFYLRNFMCFQIWKYMWNKMNKILSNISTRVWINVTTFSKYTKSQDSTSNDFWPYQAFSKIWQYSERIYIYVSKIVMHFATSETYVVANCTIKCQKNHCCLKGYKLNASYSSVSVHVLDV